MANSNGNTPIHRISLGGGRVRLNIFANEGKHGTYHTVSASRMYRDGEEVKWSQSMRRDDAVFAEKGYAQAYDWICEAEREAKEE